MVWKLIKAMKDIKSNLKNQNRPLTRKEMKIEVERLQKAGKKIVFTNGCFDLLHLGHVSLFKEAKNLGDVLIVATNSDISLSSIKGSKRPLINEKDRTELLLSLKFIDYVVVFDEQTPKEILSELRPDVLIKGDDYKLSEIIGREYVGKVYRFPIVEGKSTTNLIKLIVDRYGHR